jgi:hypothetical protein
VDSRGLHHVLRLQRKNRRILRPVLHYMEGAQVIAVSPIFDRTRSWFSLSRKGRLIQPAMAIVSNAEDDTRIC